MGLDQPDRLVDRRNDRDSIQSTCHGGVEFGRGGDELANPSGAGGQRRPGVHLVGVAAAANEDPGPARVVGTQIGQRLSGVAWRSYGDGIRDWAERGRNRELIA